MSGGGLHGDLEVALNKALVDALAASPDVTALVAGRVYDRVPEDATWPYLEIGGIRANDERAGEIVCLEVYATITGWSKATGQREARRMASAVRAALHEAELPLGEAYHLTLGEVVSSDADRLPGNPELASAVIIYRALVEGL